MAAFQYTAQCFSSLLNRLGSTPHSCFNAIVVHPKALFSQLDTNNHFQAGFIRVLSYTYVIKTHGLYRTEAIIKMYLMVDLCKPFFPASRKLLIFSPPGRLMKADEMGWLIGFHFGSEHARSDYVSVSNLCYHSFTFLTLCHEHFWKQ